ncbi:hypothetical protein G1H11_15340 [Phytoactinopolyspora alkaliphila]|uniref:TPM domain-containing protein n=1 Tax=Phytoactinopolyspora alkaliphila TaxID=1783498 RepID=A0A6N9YNW0_9ACTN|nr:hypothetical protein [Phytoactinopolyspora alkaliphila]NED96683.1 hypothetical protein [Phytoactinopolyspora alkaliphila]
MSTWRTGMLVTVAAAVAGGAGAWALTTPGVPDPIPVGDRVQAAVEGLRDSHVYIEPAVDELLTAEERAQVDAAAAASDPGVYVVVWRPSAQAGYYLEGEALAQIGAELGRPGLYLRLDANEIDSREVGIEGDYLSIPSRLDGDGDEPAASPAETLLSVISDNDGREYREADTSGSDYWGGTGGTIAAASLLGVLAGMGLALVMALGWLGVRGGGRKR